MSLLKQYEEYRESGALGENPGIIFWNLWDQLLTTVDEQSEQISQLRSEVGSLQYECNRLEKRKKDDENYDPYWEY